MKKHLTNTGDPFTFDDLILSMVPNEKAEKVIANALQATVENGAGEEVPDFRARFYAAKIGLENNIGPKADCAKAIADCLHATTTLRNGLVVPDYKTRLRAARFGITLHGT